MKATHLYAILLTAVIFPICIAASPAAATEAAKACIDNACAPLRNTLYECTTGDTSCFNNIATTVKQSLDKCPDREETLMGTCNIIYYPRIWRCKNTNDKNLCKKLIYEVYDYCKDLYR